MQAQYPSDQRAGLHGVALDQVEAFPKGFVGAFCGFQGFGERMDAGQDVSEIMGHAHGQCRQGVSPGGRTESAFGDGLSGDVEPSAFEAQQ